MKKRILAFCSALLLGLTVLSGCQSTPAEESSTSSAAPTETAEATATPEATAEPTEVPNAEPANVNLLTGLPTLTDEAVGKRPVAVMINNVEAALPQYGISAADVIFEIPVEYDLTRLMALYGDYTQVPDVCSVRSCRYYYPILAVGFDAVYVHWGMDETIARETVTRLDIDRVDALEASYGLLGRDQARLDSGYALEHTGMFYGGKLPEALENNGIRTDLDEAHQGAAFNFVPQGENAAPQGDAAGSVRVDFGGNYSTFTYDAETATYLKNYKDSPHMDSASGEQLAFENVIVLETDISVRDAAIGLKNVNWQGGASYHGYYISEGAVQPITWSKADEYSPLKFFGEDGEEVQINRGKTYIAMTYPGNCTISES